MQLFFDGTRARDGETQGYVRQFGAQTCEGIEQCDDALLGDETPRVGDDDLGVGTASRPFALVAVGKQLMSPDTKVENVKLNIAKPVVS